MPTPNRIHELIERFRFNEASYRSGNYNETQLRREFLDPFFKELGWDVDNQAGYAEAYKDVIHEDAIKVGGVTKAPDYCFRIGGARKFFLEAKKPLVNIKDDISPAFQLRRYAWSAKLPLSGLSDFEELANSADRASHDRMVKLVEQMLALHRQLAAAKTAYEQTSAQRQIEATDRQIDRLVYELYGLTAEEIQVIEEGSAS
jgi:hypothetical protein